jgi:hypothetical protein
MPAEAPGREQLARVVRGMAQARSLLDAFVTHWRGLATAEAVLVRALAAVDGRTGAAKEDVRRVLNQTGLEVQQAGARADVAWETWQRAVQTVLALAQS